MKSLQELERLRDQLHILVKLGDDSPFHPAMRSSIVAVWNCLCYITEDGSSSAITFELNVELIEEWFREQELEMRTAHQQVH